MTIGYVEVKCEHPVDKVSWDRIDESDIQDGTEIYHNGTCICGVDVLRVFVSDGEITET